MKTWILNGDILEIADGDERSPATAEQIYSSVVEQVSVWPDLAVGSSGDAAKLTFSRYPVDWKIVLGPDPAMNFPAVSFSARTQNGLDFPVSPTAIVRDHVVHERIWYPGAPGSSEAVVSIMRDAGFSFEEMKLDTLKSLLDLRKIAIQGGPVIDRLTDEVLNALLFRGDSDRPEGILADLYQYQRDGWHWLRFIMREHLGGLLADEMGLGKTLQVISALRDPGHGEGKGGALVVAPGSLLENWIREIRKFCPDFRALKHHGSERTGMPMELNGHDVVVTSYDTATRDLSLLKMVEWEAVILDEAQNIRNPDALRTKSVKQIGRKVGLAVTGTPVENRLRDLWSIMDFAVPGFLGELGEFESRYEENADSAMALEPLISPLMLRRKIAEVANDLPERIDIPEVLELNPKEAEAYDGVREDCLSEYGAAASLVSIGKLRQFCAHPGILRDPPADFGNRFTKFMRLRELLEEVFFRGEKALVFTSYLRMADRIVAMASREFGAMAETLDRRLAIGNRQGLLDRFTAHPGHAVLVLNPRAGGTGLNITAANHVIHYNPEWNPALEDQASARAFRRGQVRPVTIRRLIYAGTVEEVIDERLWRKRSIADAAIVGVEGKEANYGDIVAALQRSPIQPRGDKT